MTDSSSLSSVSAWFNMLSVADCKWCVWGYYMKNLKFSVIGVLDIHYFRSYGNLVLMNFMCVLKKLFLL